MQSNEELSRSTQLEFDRHGRTTRVQLSTGQIVYAAFMAAVTGQEVTRPAPSCPYKVFVEIQTGSHY